MAQRIRLILLFLLLALLIIPSQGGLVRAQVPAAPQSASASDLIEAVNSYRALQGLPAYTTNSILMQTAQAQANYMASIGTVTHTGPGGVSFPDRLTAAGYSYSFRSENIISGSPTDSGWSLVTSPYWADSAHQHTLLSPDLLEIGAGVAVSGGMGYYVIDCASPAGSSVSTTAVPGSAPSTGEPTIVVVIPNTPKPDGSVFHTVQPGETLWSIAIAYQTTIEDLKVNNNLATDSIYPGDTLVIFFPNPTATPGPTDTITPYPTVTPFMFSTVTSSPEPTALPAPVAPINGGSGMIIVAVIIAAALVAAGAMTAAGARKNRKSIDKSEEQSEVHEDEEKT